MVDEGQELDATSIMVILKGHIKGKVKNKDAKCSILWKLRCIFDHYQLFMIINYLLFWKCNLKNILLVVLSWS